MVAPGRFFSVATPGTPVPFAVHLVIPGGPLPAEDVDRRAIATLLGLSLAALGQPADNRLEEFETVAETLWTSRPLLASTVFPVPVEPEVVRVAADFSTCFAASVLLAAQRSARPT